MGNVNSATPPASVTMIDSTEAKIGRLMKKLENIVVCSRRSTGWHSAVFGCQSLSAGSWLAISELCGRPFDSSGARRTVIFCLATGRLAFITPLHNFAGDRISANDQRLAHCMLCEANSRVPPSQSIVEKNTG